MNKNKHIKYEVLEHPTDYLVKVYGNTLKELFFNAFFVMLNKMFKINLDFPNLLHTSYDYHDDIGALNSSEDLLIKFLSIILHKIVVDKYIPVSIIIYNLVTEDSAGDSFCFIDFETSGLLFDNKFFNEQKNLNNRIVEQESEIKTITYYNYPTIKFIDNHWETTILFKLGTV